MWQLIKAGPSLEEGSARSGAAWQVVRAAIGAWQVVWLAPRESEVERAQEQSIAVDVRPHYAPRAGAGAGVVEAVVFVAVAAYFIAGLVGLIL